MNEKFKGDSIDFLDVYKYAELPNPPEGFRFVDFLSEPKGLRCFLLPKEYPRGRFMDENEHLLDQRLIPIYKNHDICVRQDSSFPIPGFYIISPTKHYRSLDEMSDIDVMCMYLIMKMIRKGMREILGIQYIYMYYEEKISKHGDVHLWLLPVYNITTSNILLRFDLETYLNSFSFKKEKEKILEFNNKLRNYIQEIDLKNKDDLIRKANKSII